MSEPPTEIPTWWAWADVPYPAANELYEACRLGGVVVAGPCGELYRVIGFETWMRLDRGGPSFKFTLVLPGDWPPFDPRPPIAEDILVVEQEPAPGDPLFLTEEFYRYVRGQGGAQA